jgi:hypothetical protein
VTALVLLSMAGLALLAGPAAPACACSCGPATDAENAARADVVFEGVVVDIDKPLLPSTGTEVTVRFVVESVTKGAAGSRFEVRTADEEASCGFAFVPGHRYRVYAAGGQTTLCAGNRDLGAAPDVPLDEGVPWTPILGGAAVVALVVALAFRDRARRRRRRGRTTF